MDIISKIDQLKKKDIYTFEDIIQHFKNYGLFTLLFLLSFLSLFPTPLSPLSPLLFPFGIESIPFGILIIIISIYLLVGVKKIYVPKFIRNRKINVSFLKKPTYNKIKHYLKKIRLIFKPRLTWLFTRFSNNIIGILFIPLATIMIIPIVFTNLLPGICITLISMAVLFNDGLLLIIFMITGILVFLLYYKLLKRLVQLFKL
jgi:hypothetical protein